MNNVNSGKGIAFDGITDKLFQVSKLCCRGSNQFCRDCRTKVAFASELMTEEYWARQESMLHLKGRLVAFNKKHPRMPELHEYRPIIVQSPVVKFLEGYITSALRKYAR
jgi:hypothetical protein